MLGSFMGAGATVKEFPRTSTAVQRARARELVKAVHSLSTNINDVYPFTTNGPCVLQLGRL